MEYTVSETIYGVEPVCSVCYLYKNVIIVFTTHSLPLHLHSLRLLLYNLPFLSSSSPAYPLPWSVFYMMKAEYRSFKRL
jgi:putative lipase involved disintegration of autophagic bodies